MRKLIVSIILLFFLGLLGCSKSQEPSSNDSDFFKVDKEKLQKELERSNEAAKKRITFSDADKTGTTEAGKNAD